MPCKGPGRCHVKAHWLIQETFFPILSIKIGLMINFAKALNKCNPWFKFLQYKFSAVSDAKLGAVVLIGPQICDLMRDSTFDEILTKTENQKGKVLERAWKLDF